MASSACLQYGDDRSIRLYLSGSNAVQSALNPAQPELPVLSYQKRMLQALLVLEPGSVLHLGLGLGVVPRALAALVPGISQKCCENNPDVIACYRSLPRSLPPLALQLEQADALSTALNSRADILMHDAFDAHALVMPDNEAVWLSQVLGRYPLVVLNLWQSDLASQRRLSLVAQFSRWHVALSEAGQGNLIVMASADLPRPSRSDLNRRALALSSRNKLPWQQWLEHWG